MTRLRFLLVSFFAAAAACLGFDRERMARRWLRANGFKIEMDSCTLPDGRDTYFVAVHCPRIGMAGSFCRRQFEPYVNPASCFMHIMVARDFTIIEKHVRLETEGSEWETLTFREVELASPTIHRFERPWWI